MTPVRMTAAILALLSLAGCAPAPAQRESQSGMSPRNACIAQCNRDANMCTDQHSASSGNTSQVGRSDYGMGATCKGELQSCLTRC